MDSSAWHRKEGQMSLELGIGTRPFDIKGGRGKAINLVSWSDGSRQVIHPVSKLDAK